MDKGWKSQYGFIWAVLGSVVGFANVLSFSSQCYYNGGGAFLIPYFVAYMLLGIPLLILEGLIGQKFRKPLVSSYVTPLRKYIGWIAVLSCLTIGAFYIVLTSYSLIYAYFGATGSISLDTARFFKEDFLHATHAVGDFGSFSVLIWSVVCLIGMGVWWVLIKDISEGIEKICSFMMPLLALLVIIFALVASFLPGAMEGIRHFLSPDFSKLTDLSLWRNVFGQLFFSLSLGLGIITGYAQYNGEKIQLKKAMSLIAVGDFVISFIAGWVVFACVGYMSYLKGIPFNQIIASDSAFEIGFIVFPKILQTFTPFLQPLFGLLFFFCIFIAGITGVFSIVESVAGNVQREFALSRRSAVTLSLFAIGGCATFFCFGNGQMLIGALAPMVLGMTMIFSALFEIVIFLYFTKAIKDDPIWFVGERRNWMYGSLRFFIPFILFAILVGSIIAEFQVIDASFYLRWAWFGGVSLLAVFLIRSATELHFKLNRVV
ncbi:MAG: sodium-dependent transporter [Simkaniaceae bacterium]|nr:sodium-dependent transporter [Simkaniaceae bacterium]